MTEILPSTWNSPEFVEGLQTVYDGTLDTKTQDPLRQLMVKTAAEHATELLDRGEFLSLLKENGKDLHAIPLLAVCKCGTNDLSGEIATDVLRVSLTTKGPWFK